MSNTTIGTVTAKVTADTTQFDNTMKKSSEVVTATARANTKAKQQEAAATAFAAKFAGEAVQEQSLRFVAAMKLQIAATADLSKAQKLAKTDFQDEAQASNLVAAAYQRLAAAKAAVAAASEVEAAATGHAISQQMAASAAIRSLEGNPGIRSIERFASTIPGVGAGFEAIFPIIGAAGLIGILVEGGEKFVEMEQKAKHAGEAMREAFLDVNSKAQLANDELLLQNDHLQDEIDKLSGHPNNGLATALDEARQMADKLDVSLQADRKQLEQLLKEHGVGAIGELLSGVSSTGQQSSEVLSDQKKFMAAVNAANEAYTNSLKNDKSLPAIEDATKVRNAAIRKAGDLQIATYRAEAQRLKEEQEKSRTAIVGATRNGVIRRPVDNSAKIAIAEGYANEMQKKVDKETSDEGIYSKNRQLGPLRQNKEDASAENKAAEARLKAMEDELEKAQQEGNIPRSGGRVYDFWKERINQFTVGSEQYNQVFLKETAAIASMQEKLSRVMGLAKSGRYSEAMDELKGVRPEKEDDSYDVVQKGLRGNQEMAASSRKTAFDAAQSGSDLDIEQAHSAARLQELQIQEQTDRTMSKLGAATALAAVHTREYNRELDDLRTKLKRIQDNPDLTPDEKIKQSAPIRKQIETRSDAMQQQVFEDQKTISPEVTSAWYGATDALDKLADSAKNAGAQMESLVNAAVGDINHALVQELTTRTRPGEHIWTGVGHDVATKVTSTALDKGEGTLLGGLGFGGKIGTRTNPMWVVSADGKGTGGHGIIGGDSSSSSSGAPTSMSNFLRGMIGLSPKGPNIDYGGLNSAQGISANAFDSDQAAGGIATEDSDLTDLIPFSGGFADGGFAAPNTWAMVGENGPELAYTGKTGASVIPNHKAFGGGDTHHHNYNIDARGASDPAAVHSAVMRAAPQLVAASVRAVNEQQRRSPSTRR